MAKVNFSILKDSMVLNYSGKTIVVSASDARYKPVLDCIRAANGNPDSEDVANIVEIERKFNAKGVELKDGLLMAGDEPLPVELENRIVKFKELNLPYDALLKFWENLKKNPSFNSRLALFKFLEHNGHPLTQDGCFIAYRGVTEDFKDVHTKKFDNKPGSVCEMPRNLVDDNPNNTCSRGLHVACFNYARGFGTKLIEVKVNPADVVTVPTDYQGTKMRVCRFEVVAEGTKQREEVVYPEESGIGDECDGGACDVSTAPAGKTVKLNGTGDNKQLRHAVRDGKGRFVPAT